MGNIVVVAGWPTKGGDPGRGVQLFNPDRLCAGNHDVVDVGLHEDYAFIMNWRTSVTPAAFQRPIPGESSDDALTASCVRS